MAYAYKNPLYIGADDKLREPVLIDVMQHHFAGHTATSAAKTLGLRRQSVQRLYLQIRKYLNRLINELNDISIEAILTGPLSLVLQGASPTEVEAIKRSRQLAYRFPAFSASKWEGLLRLFDEYLEQVKMGDVDEIYAAFERHFFHSMNELMRMHRGLDQSGRAYYVKLTFVRKLLADALTYETGEEHIYTSPVVSEQLVHWTRFLMTREPISKSLHDADVQDINSDTWAVALKQLMSKRAERIADAGLDERGLLHKLSSTRSASLEQDCIADAADVLLNRLEQGSEA